MTMHERIWLAPDCCADPDTGRQWCEDNVWPCLDCSCSENGPMGDQGTEYVRADLVAAQNAEALRRLEMAVEALEALCAEAVESATMLDGEYEAHAADLRKGTDRARTTLAALRRPM